MKKPSALRKLLVFALFIVAFTTALRAQPMARTPQPTVNRPPTPHTGDWWKDKSGIFREAYVGGYKEGAHNALGHDTELSKFAAKDLVAGINKFYDDFRNRNIQFPQVINYVADQLRGISDDKLNAELLKMRAAAAGSAQDE